MEHEDAVLKKHPNAHEFRPVKRFLGTLYGWTFAVPREGKEYLSLRSYGWVTADGAEVSSDLLKYSEDAERNLRTYVKHKATSPST